MKRTLVVVAAVVGFAAAASASTLSVFTTNALNVAQTSFLPGDTILLKVTGDSAGGAESGAIQGQLFWNGAVTNSVSVAQGNWYGTLLNPALNDNSGYAFNQSDPRNAGVSIATSVITLVADAVGVSNVTWGGSYLIFFDIYSATPGSVPTGASFSVIPEPATAGLIGLGLLGLVLGGRRRA